MRWGLIAVACLALAAGLFGGYHVGRESARLWIEAQCNDPVWGCEVRVGRVRLDCQLNTAPGTLPQL